MTRFARIVPNVKQRAWHSRYFSELSNLEVYKLLVLRQRVFVVEQKCPYLDADGADLTSRHLCVEVGPDAAIHAYARIVPAGIKFAEVSIGRVITAPEARGTGLGRELMQRAIVECGDAPIRIGAQAHLEKFYSELGFVRASDEYDDDGIPHIEMVRGI